MPKRIRYAMCNEAFEQTPLAAVCKTLREIGYEGIEIAPFTLAPDPLDITAAQRREYADIIRSEGLTFVGLRRACTLRAPTAPCAKRAGGTSKT
jgi:D-psicose/D-tagatose/L-ribulose 3-epimerase